jgi:hypothetical protein
MSQRVPCKECGATILPTTAAATGGLCMACKQGIRKNLDQAKAYYEKLKEPDPERDYWKLLIHRIYKTTQGYSGLSYPETIYYLGCVLQGEVHNGGFHQFFTNSSGDRYSETLDALEEIGAYESRRLLTLATELFFLSDTPSKDRTERYHQMPEYGEPLCGHDPNWQKKSDELDRAFWKNPDDLSGRLTSYGIQHGLFVPLP